MDIERDESSGRVDARHTHTHTHRPHKERKQRIFGLILEK